MKKTKTKRIITISPSSNPNKNQWMQKDSLDKKQRHTVGIPNNKTKQIHRISAITKQINKSLTPVKPLQYSKHTRTSTSLKTNNKSKPSDHDFTECKATNFGSQMEIIKGSEISDYKINQISLIQTPKQNYPNNSYLPYDTRKQIKYSTNESIACSPQFYIKQDNIEAILQKIKQVDRVKNNENKSLSIAMLKKADLNNLRNLLDSGKHFLTLSQQYQNQSQIIMAQKDNNQLNLTKIYAIKQQIRGQIGGVFQKLRLSIDKKQKQLNEELEQKLFEYKQKQINKIYRLGGLKNFIEKCEVDINRNYHQIIQNLEIDKFRQVIEAYTKRLTYYLSKAKQFYQIKFIIPINFCSQMQESIANIKLNLQTKQQNLQNMILFEKQNLKRSQIQPQHQRFNNSHKNILAKSNISMKLMEHNPSDIQVHSARCF